MTYIAIALFMAGVIFYSGQLSARVTSLERWRREFREEVRQQFQGLREDLQQELRHLGQLITGEVQGKSHEKPS